MQGKILCLSCIDSSALLRCVSGRALVCICGCLYCMCMRVPSASIPHFVQIISKGMGPNAAIHTSIRATQATTSKSGGWGEKGGGEEEEEEA